MALVGLAVFSAVAGAYYFRRPLADAWRQRQVAAIPAAPADLRGSVTEKPAGSSIEGLISQPAEEPDSGPISAVTPPAASPSDSEVDTAPIAVPEEDADSPTATPEGGVSADNDIAAESDATPPADPGRPPPGPDILPERVNLDVPMVYQAPFNVWDFTHDEACEEASILMVEAFLKGDVSLTRQEMEDRIMATVDYEMETLGYFESTTAEQTAEIMRGHFGLPRVAVLPVNDIDDIRRQLAAGRPVILPADGKALGNPNFRGDGPVYHMYVAKGYTETHIIAHDPGTRRGANWLYDNETVMGSLADWVQNEYDVDRSKRVMIVIW